MLLTVVKKDVMFRDKLYRINMAWTVHEQAKWVVIEKDQAPVLSSTFNVVGKRLIDGQEITSVSWAVSPTTIRQVKVNPVTGLPPGARVHDPDEPHRRSREFSRCQGGV